MVPSLKPALAGQSGGQQGLNDTRECSVAGRETGQPLAAPRGGAHRCPGKTDWHMGSEPASDHVPTSRLSLGWLLSSLSLHMPV